MQNRMHALLSLKKNIESNKVIDFLCYNSVSFACAMLTCFQAIEKRQNEIIHPFINLCLSEG